VQLVLAVFPGIKWPGHGTDYPSPSSAEVKERVDLDLFYACAFNKHDLQLFSAQYQYHESRT
jgi:hypothetical protein